MGTREVGVLHCAGVLRQMRDLGHGAWPRHHSGAEGRCQYVGRPRDVILLRQEDVRKRSAHNQALGKENIMPATVITFLIYICVLALVIYLIIWVLTDVIGLPIPAKVIQILWVIVALVAIL